MNISRRLGIALFAVVFGCCPFAAEAQSPIEEADEQAKPNSPPSDTEFVNEGTARLAKLVGAWRFTEQHFDPLGTVIAEARGTEEISWQLDKHAVRRSYTRPSSGSVYRAECVLAYNAARDRYEGVWLDNISETGPRSIVGAWDESTQTFVYELTATDSEGRQQTYRIVERLLDKDQRTAITYRTGDGEVTKLLEVRYRRAIPCPSSSEIRIIQEPISK